VVAIDLDETRVRLARKLGAELAINASKEDAVRAVDILTGGFGADAVLFTASTASSDPISQAFRLCKKKGRVILVGVAGLDIKRDDMYAKELELRLSTSYGPGRYDREYEENGVQYPYAYVRWTENRNMGEYLRLLATRAVTLDTLPRRIFPIEEVAAAFGALTRSAAKPVVVILAYSSEGSGATQKDSSPRFNVTVPRKPVGEDLVRVGLVGAGAFATGVHLPNIARLHKHFRLDAVVDNAGLRAQSIALEYHAGVAGSGIRDILSNDAIDLVLIATRHASHAGLVLEALNAGKHVLVEKPLATTKEELKAIGDFYGQATPASKPVLMVGYNRRFSRYSEEIRKHTQNRMSPLFIHYRMNAGYIPADHWIHESGGRMVGELCHIVDLMTFLTQAEVESISSESLRPSTERYMSSDNKSIILKYRDGSVCTIEYFATGSKDFPKEYMEVHFDGKTIVLEDYKKLSGYGVDILQLSSASSEKGHLQELERLHRTLVGEEAEWPIELWDMIQTTAVTLEVSG
jgi:predicted dehydrogenase